LNSKDIVWWAKGGELHGTSPARIGFLRNLVEETGSLELADKWKDNRMAISADNKYLLIYLGKEIKGEWTFIVPSNTRFADNTRFFAEIIDTCNAKPIN
jgi:hypothetical protein